MSDSKKLNNKSKLLLGLLFIVMGYCIGSLFYSPGQLGFTPMDKPVANFKVTPIANNTIEQKMFSEKHPTLIQFWATWCPSCEVANKNLSTGALPSYLRVVGFAYRDDLQDVNNYLSSKANPFSVVTLDNNGRYATEFGVIGTPETFLLDPKGKIRYHYAGVIPKSQVKILKTLAAQIDNEFKDA